MVDRFNPNESRYWGFVPEENLVGKACVVPYSNNRNGIRWNLMLKRIK